MKKNISVIAILVSLLVHTAFVGTIWFSPNLFNPTKRTVTEIELYDAEEMLRRMKELDATKGQIVDQSEKAVNDEVPEKSKYLSRHNQKVKEETRAAQTAKFRNSTGGKASPKIEAGQVAEKEPTQKDLVQNRNGLAVGKTLKDFKPDFKIGPKAETVAKTEFTELQL